MSILFKISSGVMLTCWNGISGPFLDGLKHKAQVHLGHVQVHFANLTGSMAWSIAVKPWHLSSLSDRDMFCGCWTPFPAVSWTSVPSISLCDCILYKTIHWYSTEEQEEERSCLSVCVQIYGTVTFWCLKKEVASGAGRLRLLSLGTVCPASPD